MLSQMAVAFRQTPEQVFTRPPGHRLLKGPEEVASEAAKHWEYACLSEAAYEREPPAGGVNVVAALKAAGWSRWTDVQDIESFRSFGRKNKLRVQVWEKRDPAVVAVTFCGTVAKIIGDWEANFRWFIRAPNDEYTMVIKNFGKAFSDAYNSKVNTHAYLRNAKIVATGHSLGGGLAQQFAYSLPESRSVPRVKQVYAFDPSPVTGFRSVKPELRIPNATGLLTDRIYQRGEILAFARSITNSVWPPSAKNPSIRTIRYNLFYSLNFISNHSMYALSAKLLALSAGLQQGGSRANAPPAQPSAKR